MICVGATDCKSKTDILHPTLYFRFTQVCLLNLQVQYYNNYLRDPKRPQMAEAPAGKPQGRRDGPHGRGPPNEQ